VEIYECEWMHQYKTSATKRTFINGLKTVKPRYDLTQEKNIRDVQNGKLFRMLLYDIETYEDLKPKFEEFCPIFKNTTVSRDDIGEHMREYAERNNVFVKPRRMLIGSYFGEKILLITPLVKWYLDHSLKVTKFYEFIEYMNLWSITRRNALKNSVSMCPRCVVPVTATPQRSFWARHKSFMEILRTAGV